MENSSGEGSSRSSLTSEDSLIPQRLQVFLTSYYFIDFMVSPLHFVSNYIQTDKTPKSVLQANSVFIYFSDFLKKHLKNVIV